MNDKDKPLQEFINKKFSKKPSINWKDWLDISSIEEYEDVLLRNTGFSSDIFKQIGVKKTDPKSLSIDANVILNPQENMSEFIKLQDNGYIISCHTSGTSGGDLDSLKWYKFSNKLIKKIWAPGMLGIFESSGLNNKNSVVVFAPSRIKHDGMELIENIKLIKLYSAEFSQRLAISLLKPKSYLFDEYKNALDLGTMDKILSMDDIGVVSAPAATILKWADLSKLRAGIKKSLNNSNSEEIRSSYLYSLIKNKGLEKASILIHQQLSEILSKATHIMSTTSLSLSKWKIIRDFLRWKVDEEKITSLYVGSEVGPFAATIDKSKENRNKLCVFPLAIPVIERKNKKELITRAINKFGRLLISRNESKPQLNIDTGDIITIKDLRNLPKISQIILRSGFEIKFEVLSSGMPKNSKILTGDYFDLYNFEIYNPNLLKKCLETKFNLVFNSENPLILIKGKPCVLILSPLNGNQKKINNLKQEISVCQGVENLKHAIDTSSLIIEDKKIAIKPKKDFQILKNKVRNGELPKGILKKWSFFVISPQTKI